MFGNDGGDFFYFGGSSGSPSGPIWPWCIVFILVIVIYYACDNWENETLATEYNTIAKKAGWHPIKASDNIRREDVRAAIFQYKQTH